MECLRATESRNLVNAANLVRADRVIEGKLTRNLSELTKGDVLDINGVREKVYKISEGNNPVIIGTWKILTPGEVIAQQYMSTKQMLSQGILEIAGEPLVRIYPPSVVGWGDVPFHQYLISEEVVCR